MIGERDFFCYIFGDFKQMAYICLVLKESQMRNFAAYHHHHHYPDE